MKDAQMELLQLEVGPDGFCTGRDITPAGGAVRIECTRHGEVASILYVRGGVRHRAYIAYECWVQRDRRGLLELLGREDDYGRLRTIAGWIRRWDAE